MLDTGVVPSVTLSCPGASLSDQSGNPRQGAHTAAMRTWPSTLDPPCMARRQSWAREDWGHTGRPAQVLHKHTPPQALPRLPGRTPESRGSKLKTSSHKVCARLRGAQQTSPPSRISKGRVGKAAGQLPCSVLRAPLSCRERGSISPQHLPPTQPLKATTRIPMALPETALKKAGCWQSAWKRAESARKQMPLVARAGA